MPIVGASVNDSTKEEWEEYVEESDHGSMSELVRIAVRKEIQRSGTKENGIPREVRKDINQVAEKQDSLSKQMDTILEGFEELEQTNEDEDYDEETKALAHRISEEMEEINEDQFEEAMAQRRKEVANLARKISDKDERYPYSPNQVHNAFEYLEENISYIRKLPPSPSEYHRVVR